MTTWQELSKAEQRVLDNANEDYTQFWELGVTVKMYGRDKAGRDVEWELPPIPQDEVRRAIRRLLDLGLIELIRRRGVDRRAPIAPDEHEADLTDPENWRPGGEVEVVATDAGRQIWMS